uniref:TIR domain-containing protein n=1 Tax=Scleropages formosus TaxID=113540 RepID=A0A8C9S226_SCLFO
HFEIVSATKHENIESELCVTLRQARLDLSYHNCTAVPKNLPANTQYLDLSHSDISRLKSNDVAGIPNLCHLNLSYHKIQHISPTVFTNNRIIKVLIISYNFLMTIPDFHLPQYRVLDISGNLYSSYRLGNSFRNLTSLNFLLLGTPFVDVTEVEDFASLRNIPLKHLIFSESPKLQRFKPGSLAEIKDLQEVTLTMNLNQTETLRLIKFLPQYCSISSDPFEGFKETQFLSKLAFVNIVYNEDTPDGSFLLPHTVKLRSLIFNGIMHYQYSYPKININVAWLSQMTYLKFSGTGMNIPPCKLILAIPPLMTLDLSDNLLNDEGFRWPGCSYTKAFPVLRQLSLSRNRFVNLSFISPYLSFNSIQLGKECYWPSHLVELSLSNNDLGNCVFGYLSPHFRQINLSKTGITAVTQKAITSFPNLTHLFLSSNSIQSLPADLQVISMLVLYVDQNAITSISQGLILGLPRLHSLMAGNNPFSCSCNSYWFVTALNILLLPDWPMDYICAAPPSFTGMLGVWISVKQRSCMGNKRLHDASFHYHAFVSYSQHDSNWVESHLVPSLEIFGLSLCIHDRDFVPGLWIVDNIINCVENSYKTLFVLSQNFVQSEWFSYELFFAQRRAISTQENSLVFFLLELIPANSLPQKFLKLKTLLREQTYLEWPED